MIMSWSQRPAIYCRVKMFDYWPRNGEAVKHRSSTTCDKREKTGQTELAPQKKAIKLTNQNAKQIHAFRKRAWPSGLTLAEDVVRRFQANQKAQLTETWFHFPCYNSALRWWLGQQSRATLSAKEYTPTTALETSSWSLSPFLAFLFN